jgi:hypothetical protein
MPYGMIVFLLFFPDEYDRPFKSCSGHVNFHTNLTPLPNRPREKERLPPGLLRGIALIPLF